MRIQPPLLQPLLLLMLLQKLLQTLLPKTPGEFWQMISSIVVAVALVATFIQVLNVRRQVALTQRQFALTQRQFALAEGQFALTQHQVALTQRAQGAQSAMEIVKQLTSQEVKAAEKKCDELWKKVGGPRSGSDEEGFRKKRLSEWDNKDRGQFRKRLKATWQDEDKEALKVMCNVFDVAAIFIEAGLVEDKIIIDNWGFKIRQTYELAGPLIEETRERFRTGETYWDGFQRLAKMSSIQV